MIGASSKNLRRTAKAAFGELRVGTSGYHYNHWKGIFYPDKLPKAQWFRHYAQHFDTVEINNTFYRLPSAAAFDGWRKQTPAGFCYALKFNRYGTHWMRLKEPERTIGNFLAVAKRLRSYLGPVLVQLPPHWNANATRLGEFLAAAPSSVRWAVEFRNPSWLVEEVFAVLREHRAALCIHDMIPDHPRLLTAGWTYLRFHGNHYGGSYPHEKLAGEAKWIGKQLASGADVFAYFNNDAQGHAVANAADLKRLVGRGRRTEGRIDGAGRKNPVAANR
jgi:uncharacterized protein YecE (DUF72 family)